jgi:hypothetical protein
MATNPSAIKTLGQPLDALHDPPFRALAAHISNITNTMVDQSLFSHVVSTLLGAVLTAFGSGLQSRWQEARDRKKKEKDILRTKREQLDSDTDLLNVKAILRAEQKGHHPNDIDGGKLRDLAGFLETIASHWEFGDLSIRAAYNAFGDETILCDESQIMWRDSPKNDIYWRAFTKFAAAIQAERKLRGEHQHSKT